MVTGKADAESTQDPGLPDKVYTVTPNAPVHEVAQLMAARGIGDVLVVEADRPIGIVTDRDIAMRVAAVGAAAQAVPIRDVMSAELITVRADEDLSVAVALMGQHGIRRLPIVDAAGRLQSILTFDDILRLGLDNVPDLRRIVTEQLGKKAAAAPQVKAAPRAPEAADPRLEAKSFHLSRPVAAVARATMIHSHQPLPQTKLRYAYTWLFWRRGWITVAAWLTLLALALAAWAYLSAEGGWFTLRSFSGPSDTERQKSLERLELERERAQEPPPR